MLQHFKEIIYDTEGSPLIISTNEGSASKDKILLAYLTGDIGENTIRVVEAASQGNPPNKIYVDEFTYNEIKNPNIKPIYRQIGLFEHTTPKLRDKALEQIFIQLTGYRIYPENNPWKPFEKTNILKAH